jgi:transcription elongation GreA/GreB family factor
MSKAFTDEEALSATVPGRLVQRAARGEERPVTPAGYAWLQARVGQAKAALLAASPDTRLEHEHRLALAQATLESVRVVEVPVPSGVAGFGHEVEVAWDDGRRQVVQVVGPDEVQGPGQVSVVAPLGQALLGREVGGLVELERPRGLLTGTVVDVRQARTLAGGTIERD